MDGPSPFRRQPVREHVGNHVESVTWAVLPAFPLGGPTEIQLMEVACSALRLFELTHLARA